jgi:hypothetical protein
MASPEEQLERKMAQLQRYVSRIEAVAVFLTKHPTLASKRKLVPLAGSVGLEFEERAFIRPVGKHTIVLRLERYSEDEKSHAERTVCEDVSVPSGRELATVLLQVQRRPKDSLVDKHRRLNDEEAVFADAEAWPDLGRDHDRL